MAAGRATPPLLKDLNERTVLEAIREGAPISRAEISRRVGISKPTVSLALQSLLSAGLVREAEPHGDGPSYGATFFEPVSEAAFVLGLDLGARYVRGAVCDVRGEIRARHDVELPKRTAAASLDAIELLTRSLLDINVLHDRNPIAVKLSDGSIRNAYTVRLLNKRGFDRVIAIDVDGPLNATVHVVGVDSVTPDRPMIVIGRDQTTELRLLVTAPSEENPEKSVPVKFRVTDIGLGEAASATDHFVSP